MAAWAETEIPLAADLLAGDQDPRSSVVALLRRALAALPQAIRDGAAAAGQKIALRADAGYFAGDLARAAAKADMAFAIGAKRITSMWKALAGIAEDAWRDAIDMADAQVAVSPYHPADWPDSTVLLVRRVKLDPDQVSADPRSRRRRTLHPDQRALPIPELEQEPAIYAYSFICTNIDVSPRPGPWRASTGTGTAPPSRTSSVTASTAPRCGTCPRRMNRSTRRGCGRR